MGECLITRRGEVTRLPTLHTGYPADTAVTIGKSVTLSVVIAEAGYPANYTYQWYVNGAAVSGATGSSYTYTRTSVGSDSVYCVVTNGAGSVQSRTAAVTVTQEYIVKNGVCTAGSIGWTATDPDSVCAFVSGGFSMIGDGAGNTIAYTTETFDLTGKNKLVFRLYYMAYSDPDKNEVGTVYFGAGTSQQDVNFAAQTAQTPYDLNEDAWVWVDVSNLSGQHYIKIAIVRDCDYQDIVYIGDIYFE